MRAAAVDAGEVYKLKALLQSVGTLKVFVRRKIGQRHDIRVIPMRRTKAGDG